MPFHTKSVVKDIALFLVFIVGVLVLITTVIEHQNYDWQWHRIWKYIVFWYNGELYPGALLRGLVTTLEIAVLAMIISAILGLLVALMQSSRLITARFLSRVYIEFVRNIPILVLLFLFYFVIAPIFGFSRFWSGVLTLAMYEAAFAAEIYRAGIESVAKGQKEAAAAIGLTRFQMMFHVVIPQSLPLVLPAMTNLMINLVKHSAIVSVIAIFDLTNEGRNVIAETFLVFEVWFSVAALYLVITVLLSLLASRIESYTRRFLSH